MALRRFPRRIPLLRPLLAAGLLLGLGAQAFAAASGDFYRDVSRLKPNALVNVTNDAWFGKTSEPMLHLALAMMRTVEHRLWLIRSTNTGISAFVDPNGRLVQHTSVHDAETPVQSVAMMPRSRTIYSYIGDILGWFALAWLFILAIAKRSFRKSEGENQNKNENHNESSDASENKDA